MATPTRAPKNRTRTPEQAREIARRYGFNISGRIGTTVGRIVAVAISAIIAAVASLLVVGFFNLFVGLGSPYFDLLVLAGWLMALGAVSPYFLVNVPKFAGLIVTSYFQNGALHVFGPGLGLKYPWEYYSQKDYIDLRAISVEKRSRFVSKDGVGVTFGWTQQYGAWLDLLPLYVRTEEKAITDGFVDVVEHALQEIITSRKVKVLLTKKALDDLQQAVEDAIDGDIVDSRDSMGSTLEERFGILAELTTVGPPEFDKDYLEALSGRAVRDIMTSEAKKMSEELNISAEKAMKNIMMINKESVSETVFTLHADDNVADVARDMGEVLRTGREIARGVQAAQPSRRNRGGGSQKNPPATPDANQQGDTK